MHHCYHKKYFQGKQRSYFTGVIFISIIFFGFFGLAKSSQAATINAASCEQADVQAAIDAASDGGTVVVPSCARTNWSSLIYVNKNIKIQGQGIGSTLIGIYGFVIANGTDHVRITGMDFLGDNSAFNDPGDNAEAGAIKLGRSKNSNGPINLRVDHCKFTNYFNWITSNAAATGVIDHNDFYNGYSTGIRLQGDNATSWSAVTGLGTANYIFIEDNYFYKTNPGAVGVQKHVVMGQVGARFVFRWNTLSDAAGSGEDLYYWSAPVDVHGCCPYPGLTGTRAWEVYDNTYYRNNTSDCCEFFQLRGGTGVVFGNKIYYTTGNHRFTEGEMTLKDYRAGDIVRADNHSATACGFSAQTDPTPCNPIATPAGEGYPCCDQPGRGKDQELEPIYIWDNQYTIDGGSNWNSWSNLINQSDYNPTAIQADRDYYEFTKSGYIAHTYPHPLTIETDITSPAAPQGLLVQ